MSAPLTIGTSITECSFSIKPTQVIPIFNMNNCIIDDNKTIMTFTRSSKSLAGTLCMMINMVSESINELWDMEDKIFGINKMLRISLIKVKQSIDFEMKVLEIANIHKKYFKLYNIVDIVDETHYYVSDKPFHTYGRTEDEEVIIGVVKNSNGLLTFYVC
jgi:hypothetical protein